MERVRVLRDRGGRGAGVPGGRQPDGVAFLDTRPVFKGTCWWCPGTHLVTLTDLPAEAAARLLRRWCSAWPVAVETGLGAGGTFVALNNKVSQSVPHLHTHVVPRTKGDGLRGFFWPRTRYADDAEAESYATRVCRRPRRGVGKPSSAADGNACGSCRRRQARGGDVLVGEAQLVIWSGSGRA